ncbi:MAG: phosphotransferase, partial [Actinomycetota bacterium]|nr:phosphotransferase [Actinomycetota bacterium]
MSSRVLHPDQLSEEWLTEAIGIDDQVVSFDRRQIGTGQVGANFRLALTWRDRKGPSSVVAKFASLDEQSRETGIQTLTYEREVAFYRELRDTVAIASPHAYAVDIRPGTSEVVVLMEDLAPRVQGDQLAGCSVAEAELAMIEAARLHGPRWGDPALWDFEWLSRRSGEEVDGAVGMLGVLYPAFVERYQWLLSPAALEVGSAIVAGIDGWFRDAPSPVTVIHGDYRLDNMMFGAGLERPLVVVDWQT